MKVKEEFTWERKKRRRGRRRKRQREREVEKEVEKKQLKMSWKQQKTWLINRETMSWKQLMWRPKTVLTTMGTSVILHQHNGTNLMIMMWMMWRNTTIGKGEYTPGILEMTAICQPYTRKRWMYDENLVYDW
jgi:hypothetical protein